MNTFEELGLSQEALVSLAEVGFTEPTEIQSKTIGIVAGRRDLIASAQTGSGKTAAYALPILDILRSEERSAKPKTKALVIVPTRELALQVCGEFERFGGNSVNAVALYGGVGYRKQVQSLHRGADIIVATPGRLLDCLNRNYATLAKVQVVVLDEADRLLDMGFMPQVRAVIARAPEARQTLMFSATIDARMKKIADEFLKTPEVVATNNQKIEPSSIEQQFHYMKEAEKEAKLIDLLKTVEDGSVLVFTKTRAKASKLAARLQKLEIKAEEIHGDISQSQRVRTLNGFRSGDFNILVATDVAARGLDIPAISHVINYDLPMLAEDYVHRIGRTGRAGKSGIAHSFVSNDQRHLVKAIHDVLKNANQEVDDRPVQQRLSREAIDYADRLSSGNGSRPTSNGRPGVRSNRDRSNFRSNGSPSGSRAGRGKTSSLYGQQDRRREQQDGRSGQQEGRKPQDGHYGQQAGRSRQQEGRSGQPTSRRTQDSTKSRYNSQGDSTNPDLRNRKMMKRILEELGLSDNSDSPKNRRNAAKKATYGSSHNTSSHNSSSHKPHSYQGKASKPWGSNSKKRSFSR